MWHEWPNGKYGNIENKKKVMSMYHTINWYICDDDDDVDNYAIPISWSCNYCDRPIAKNMFNIVRIILLPHIGK